MAAYAATATLEHPGKSERLHLSRLGIAYGQVNVTNYNSTLVEITGITNLFRSDPTVVVILDGPSDEGYHGTWVQASGSIKCWAGVDASATADGPEVELTDDTDAGSFNFLAIGVAR